ncbi:MAG: hypothetical protein AUJ55_00565 [Proteobacteria bacterium CG1_02_64_396]|nr:MAG: hypothetical protein AUJ55_00565 [Proteobacteria bacterium CG1_02_64_396]
MALDVQRVAQVATLSRLALSQEEQTRMAGQLSAILEYIDHLQEVDTDGVSPSAANIDRQTPMREDVVSNGDIRDKLIERAPASVEGCFLVPPVIE